MEIGQRIGPFELVERIGVTPETTLFRATREGAREPREVAIRVARGVEDAAAADAVRREYEVLRALDDNRIPKVHGFYPGQAALAVSWQAGVSLAEVLSAARAGQVELDAATAIDIAVEVAGALRAAHTVVLHGRPIVHGHLDPSRIRLAADGEVSVVGFGVERRGQWLGCTAPEQIAGEPAGPAADQWALGAILVEMLLLRRLYEGLDDPARASLEGAVGPWVAAVESRQPSLGRVLRKMLAPEAEDRFPWDGEIVQALLAEAREIGAVSGRRAVVAAVLRERARLAVSQEPVPIAVPIAANRAPPAGPGPGLRIPIRGPRDEEDEDAEDEGTAPAGPLAAIRIAEPTEEVADEAFSDHPTNLDDQVLIADHLFPEGPTDADTTDDGGLRDTDGGEGAGPEPEEPRPPAAPQLLLSERVGLALAGLLALVAVVFLVTRLIGP